MNGGYPDERKESVLLPHRFRTHRLVLRTPRLTDAEAIFDAYARDPEVTKYLVWQTHSSIEVTREFLRECLDGWSRGDDLSWVISEGTSDYCIGLVGLRLRGFKADVGYVLVRPFWGKGFMPEAVQVVIDAALSVPAIHRVWAVCDVENLASSRVLEKVGMSREGILKRWIVHPAMGREPRDCYCYAKVK